MSKTTRRALLLTGAAALFTPAIARAQQASNIELVPSGVVTSRNASSFVVPDWRDHFPSLGVATIIADTKSRALHFWNAAGTDYRVFATSVPKSDELTRRGYTKIVRKRVGPTWTPTADMRRRDPSLPEFMDSGEPGNPLGTHAMYLDWPAYLIHGTHDTRKIGRRSSSGCIGLYNEQIAELFAITPVGTQVRLI
ncbi:L,D-transpeptidase [uncultured Litoreibacter sp.]|uniref:L,D-transpeptidase n=1 Tax=uncultured Litoreibacter sp. TaxID=1392394 RepID=UPI002602183B|nr:L,D-transpeptidase [uncultured Litoreibacter sp.]